MAEGKTLYVTLGLDERATLIKSITSSAQDDEEFAIIKAFMHRLRIEGEDAPPVGKTAHFLLKSIILKWLHGGSASEISVGQPPITS
jgi:hypothetical protein